MTTAVLNVRMLSFAVMALVLLLSCFRPVAAQEVDPLLDAIHKFRLQNFLALNAFYNYNGNPDPELMADIVQSVNRANELMKEIDEKRNSALAENTYQDLATYFQEHKILMNSNVLDVKETGYSDLRVVAQMAAKANELGAQSEEAYQAALKSAGRSDNSPVEMTREASLRLAKMMTQYSGFSSSNVAQVFQGSGDSAPIDEQARSLDQLMAELRAIEPANPTSKEALRKAKSTWDFIRDSYIDYTAKNVSFVINRYSKSIIKNLETAIPGLAGA